MKTDGLIVCDGCGACREASEAWDGWRICGVLGPPGQSFQRDMCPECMAALPEPLRVADARPRFVRAPLKEPQ